MNPTELLIALDFDEAQPLPIGIEPGTIHATVSGTVYELVIADDDPIWSLLARCEGCGNAASVDGRWCRGCAP